MNSPSSSSTYIARARTAGQVQHGPANGKYQRSDMSEAWFDLCCGMVEDLRADMMKVRTEVVEYQEEVSTLRDCLRDIGIVSPVRFEVQMHRRRFALAAARHGLSLEARWTDLLEIKDIFTALGAQCGPSAVMSICASSRSINAIGKPILHSIKDLYAGEIYVSGGSRDGVQGGLNTVERYEPSKGIWEFLPPMAARREFGSTGIIDGKLYICGGRAGTQPLSSVECFDPALGSWQQMPDMLFARAGASGAVLNGRLYVCGGWRGTQFFKSVENFDPSLGLWQVSPQLLVQRGDPAAAALDGVLYVCGGFDGIQQLSSVEAYYPKLQLWRHASGMCERRMGLTAAACKGRLYACGGSSGTRALNSAESFSPEAGCWEALPAMSAGRFCAASTATGGKIYVFGGMFVGRCLDTVEVFDPLRGIWSEIPSMSERRTGATVAAALK